MEDVIGSYYVDFINNQNSVIEILCRHYIGALDSEQSQPLKRAKSILFKLFEYKSSSVKLKFEELTCEEVRRHHFTSEQLIDWLLAGDIHLITTHPHQGLINSTVPRWSMNELYNIQLPRLEKHIGFPMNEKLKCPIFQQDKIVYIRSLENNSITNCNPTLSIPITDPDNYDNEEYQQHLVTSVKR